MKKIFTLIAIAIASVSMVSCSLCGVDGTEEGVFIKKPLFFGDGGVDTDLWEKEEYRKVFQKEYNYPDNKFCPRKKK